MEDLQRHRNLGKAHYERGEYSLAVSELEKTLAFEAVSGRDYFNLGMAYLQDQQEDRALSAFTTAGQMEPGLIEVDFGLGILHKRALRYPLALESFQKVAARDPQDPCTSYNLGAVLSSMRRIEEAEAAFRSVLDQGHARAQNFYVSALFRYATLLAQQGKREEAQKHFAEFERLREETPHVALTETALENGRYSRVEPPPSPSPAPPSKDDRPEPPSLEAKGILETGCESGLALGDYGNDSRIDVFVTVPCGGTGCSGIWAAADSRTLPGLPVLGVARRQGALFIDDENSGAPSLSSGESGNIAFIETGEAGSRMRAQPLESRPSRHPSSRSPGISTATGSSTSCSRAPRDASRFCGTRGTESSPPTDRSRPAVDRARSRRPISTTTVFRTCSPSWSPARRSSSRTRAARSRPSASVGEGVEGRVDVVDFRSRWPARRPRQSVFSLNRQGRFHRVEERHGAERTSFDLDGDGSLERLTVGSDGTVRLLESRRVRNSSASPSRASERTVRAWGPSWS
jgi:hypothetical protein